MQLWRSPSICAKEEEEEAEKCNVSGFKRRTCFKKERTVRLKSRVAGWPSNEHQVEERLLDLVR